MLTVHILAGPNDREIDRCLGSLTAVDVPFEILVGDLGLPRSAARRLNRVGRVVPADAGAGLDACRNKVLEGSRFDWQFYVEPWEVLGSWCGLPGDGGARTFGVVRGDSVARQVRLWRRSAGGFVNPVYERVDVGGKWSSGVILGSEPPDTADRDEALAGGWVAGRPTAAAPYYHRSCVRLSRGDFGGFMEDAEKYLFRETDPGAVIPVTMTRYYMACVQCYRLRDAPEAVRRLGPCLVTNPLMAEFWCLLGDVHYHVLGRFDKAAHFYGAAAVMGSRRLKEDPWPMEVSKYGEYPKVMADSCRGLI